MRFDISEDGISRRSDILLSSQRSSSKSSSPLPSESSGDHSIIANSTATGGSTKDTARSVSNTVSTFSASGNPSNFLLNPRAGNQRRRRPKSAPSKGFRPKSNVPPLDFGKAGLISRDEEIAALRSCYDRLLNHGKKELIFVGGRSGSGKSTLIRSVANDIPVEGIFVEGKFDMNTSSEPYSGVAKAFGTICQQIKEAGPEATKDLGEDLRKELGDNPGLLVQLIPELQDILAIETAPDDPSVRSIERVYETEGGVDRLRFAFRVLTRVLGTVFSPLIIVLDALQWADVSSLQILEYLISDTQNENPLMIIASYRSEEVDENSLLRNKLTVLRQKTDKYQYNITELALEAFSVVDTEKVITKVLPTASADDTAKLATLCHKRTLGNPFFTIEFLKMLHLEGMLAFDKTLETWSWNLSSIEEATMSTANVVDMLQQHLRKLPEQVQALLQCSAYLGSAFSEATIDLVWKVYGRRLVDERIKEVSSLLSGLVADGVFEKGKNKQYRWAHDKLQEAALYLSGNQRRETFQLDIGKSLYYGLTEEQVEEDLFPIVDLINNGNILKRPEFATANLRAAEKAREISAFHSAAEYAAEGISLMEDADWGTKKSTALKLYTIGAEAELMLGNVGTAERYREAVLCRSDLSTFEMLPLQINKVKALGENEAKSKEALEYCLKMLKNLGCRLTYVRTLAFPQAVANFIRITKKAKAKPESFYNAMKASNDTKQKFIGFLLSKVVYNSYVAGDIPMYLLATVKLVDLTLQFGVNEFSATAFTYLATLSHLVLRDYAAMERFQNIALSMLKNFRGIHGAETIFVGHLCGLLWLKPLEAYNAISEESILSGRREGDSVYTSFCILNHVINLPYAIGRPLHTMLEGCPSMIAEFEETKLTAHVSSTKSLFQMLVNLSDPSCKSPSALIGEIHTNTKDDGKGDPSYSSANVFAEGELVFWHEDYEVSAKRALKVGDLYAKMSPGVIWCQIESFHRAVALYVAAFRTKKRKYLRAANTIRKRIAIWAQHGNTTTQYYNVFLLAAYLTLKKKPEEAKLKYEQALEAVGRLGHLHHLGLFNELYSDFLHDQNNEEESKYRLQEAIRYFREWGAIHKVKALESRL